MKADPQSVRGMENYIGSIAFSADGRCVAATSPRGGMLQVYDVISSELLEAVPLEDVCGVSVARGKFIATSGTGVVRSVLDDQAELSQSFDLAWDNHLVRV